MSGKTKRGSVNEKKYWTLVSSTEAFLEKYGDNYLGVAWTKSQEHANTRYRIMLEVIRPQTHRKIKLLDFGCGASHLYEYILKNRLEHIEYSGLDLSRKFLDLSRKKFPSVQYFDLDVREDPEGLPEFDYIVINGVFTTKFDLSFEDMFEHLRAVVRALFKKARVGIAFNVMSKHVDWEREDLFHLPLDELAAFLTKEVSQHFRIRHDYGLHEYTAHVYREPDFGGGER